MKLISNDCKKRSKNFHQAKSQKEIQCLSVKSTNSNEMQNSKVYTV